MKCLSEIETLQIRARPNDGGWILNGQLNWVTNLRKSGFVVATVVENEIDDTLFVMAVPCSSSGMHRSADLQLMGLQSSNTAALSFEKVNVGRDWLLHADARAFLPSVRPAFLGLQCGLAIGLARRALQEAEAQLQNKRSMLFKTLLEQRSILENSVSELKCGLLDGRFLSEPVALFRLRIDLAESASKAVQLELQASGGNAYLSDHGSGFARRWRESALIPIITPSLVQLCEELQRKGQEAAA
jgi:alkylation response protein AidB-like acyl-CoA dehydrogenase